jgi:hypothetical protein
MVCDLIQNHDPDNFDGEAAIVGEEAKHLLESSHDSEVPRQVMHSGGGACRQLVHLGGEAAVVGENRASSFG